MFSKSVTKNESCPSCTISTKFGDRILLLSQTLFVVLNESIQSAVLAKTASKTEYMQDNLLFQHRITTSSGSHSKVSVLNPNTNICGGWQNLIETNTEIRALIHKAHQF